ncbi:MAG: hypothetical protein ABI977_21350, partial [Acidobacteriota bacterium]
MLQTLRLSFPQFFDLPSGAASGELSLQARVRFRFDGQGDWPDVRRVGLERVFDQDRLEIGILLVHR